MAISNPDPRNAAARQLEVLGDKPRISPLAPEDCSPEQRELIERFQPPRQVRSMKGASDTEWSEILARHPALFAAHMGFAQQFLVMPALSPRDRELAVLRLAWISGAPFEWGGHVTIAKACGVSAEEIERVIEGVEAPDWNAYDRALLRAVDELHTGSMICDATWGALAEKLDERQLIEFVMLIGHYTTVAYYQNALRFRLPEGNEGLLAR
jgi:alkylhydroperoxidase family enzyme